MSVCPVQSRCRCNFFNVKLKFRGSAIKRDDMIYINLVQRDQIRSPMPETNITLWIWWSWDDNTFDGSRGNYFIYYTEKVWEGIGSRFPFSNKKQPLYRWWSSLNGIENWDHDNCVVIIIVTWIFWSTMTYRIRNHIIYWPEPEESINTHRWYMDMRVWIESLSLSISGFSTYVESVFFVALEHNPPVQVVSWWAALAMVDEHTYNQ